MDERLHKSDHLGIGPVRRADNLVGQASIAIENVRLRNFVSTEAAHQPLFGIAKYRIRDPVCRNEFLKFVRILIHAHADYAHAEGPHLRREFFEAGRLHDARRTPRGPKIYQRHLMAAVSERVISRAQAGQGKLWRAIAHGQRLRRPPPDEAKHTAENRGRNHDSDPQSFAPFHIVSLYCVRAAQARENEYSG